MNNQSRKGRQRSWSAFKWTGLAVATGVTSLALAQQSEERAPAAEPASFLAEELDEVAAAVVAIDATKRLISLKSDDGREFTVEAGEDVRNFSQIEVGDEVNVQYYQALAAEVTKAEGSSAEDAAVLLGARAAEGERPAGASGMLYTAIVTIDSVDTATNTVSFTGPEGNQRETTVQRDEAREFIAQLKPGDRVQLTYGEALAVAVVPSTEERVLR